MMDLMMIHVIKLEPGQDLIKEINFFLMKAKIEAACFVSAVGSLIYLKLRLANQSTYSEYKKNYEILNLSGTLSNKGCHVHGIFSDSVGLVTGGHLGAEGCVIRTTAEIIIMELTEWKFERLADKSTGYLELVATKKES